MKSPARPRINSCLDGNTYFDGVTVEAFFWTRPGAELPNVLSQELIRKGQFWGKWKNLIPWHFLVVKKLWTTGERQGPRRYNIALLSKARSDAGSLTRRRSGQSRSVCRASGRNTVTSLCCMESPEYCREQRRTCWLWIFFIFQLSHTMLQ